MSWDQAMNRILPPRGGKSAHITSPFGKVRTIGSSPHGGTDFNYQGGQTGINLTYPPVYAAIGGQVTFTQGSYGTVKIRDADGNSHEVLHLTRIAVGSNATVTAGQLIGYMAGTGPKGTSTYARHVHYQIKLPSGKSTDPVAWWNANGNVPEAPEPDPEADDLGNVPQPGGVQPVPPALQSIRPKLATAATASGADRALWTNRVPEHEPWPRVLKAMPQKDPNATQAWDDANGMAYQDADVAQRHELNRHHNDEFHKDSAWVGRAEGDEIIERNRLWKR